MFWAWSGVSSVASDEPGNADNWRILQGVVISGEARKSAGSEGGFVAQSFVVLLSVEMSMIEEAGPT